MENINVLDAYLLSNTLGILISTPLSMHNY